MFEHSRMKTQKSTAQKQNVYVYFCLLGGGRSEWRPGSGREEVEQENTADAAWFTGLAELKHALTILIMQ